MWRWLSEDAIRPWSWRSWVFPRDPAFAEKAGRVLDLYERRWQGRWLRPGADRVTGFQEHHRENARPFQWTFTRQDLHRLTARLEHDGRLTPAA